MGLNKRNGAVFGIATSRSVNSNANQLFLLVWYNGGSSIKVVDIIGNNTLVITATGGLTGQPSSYFGFDYNIALTFFPVPNYF